MKQVDPQMLFMKCRLSNMLCPRHLGVCNEQLRLHRDALLVCHGRRAFPQPRTFLQRVLEPVQACWGAADVVLAEHGNLQPLEPLLQRSSLHCPEPLLLHAPQPRAHSLSAEM